MESFRRRRARLKQSFDDGPSLDFEAGGDLEDDLELDADLPSGRVASLEIEGSLIASSGPETDSRALEAQPLARTDAGLRILSAAAVEAGELSLDHPPSESEPVEIIAEPAVPVQEEVALGLVPTGLPVAPLGRRFLAGMADALILLAAAGLFALVFWRAGGSLSRQPLNYLVLGLIAAFFIFVYFGLFTTLTSSTPGLLWMGLEVRNFEGEYPAARESFWRAFGYLISIAGLMLGFVWTLVDTEKLSWHDRISNTFLTVSAGRS